MLVHSIIFNKKKYSSSDARRWLAKHGYVPIKRVDNTLNYHRYRIRDPSLFKTFVTKEIIPGISIVFGLS